MINRPALLLAFLLAGCNTGPVPDAPVYGEVTVHFWQAHDDQVIEIKSLDRQALTSAELVLPGGTRVPAYSIDTEANPSTRDLDAFNASAAPPTGSVLLPTGGSIASVTQDHTTMVGAIASAALIRVPEMVPYRAAWLQARIEVTLGETDRRVLPAPKPE